MNEMFTMQARRALFENVVRYIESAKTSVARVSIEAHFAGTDRIQLSRVLKSACGRNLIHVVERGIFRAGPRPEKPFAHRSGNILNLNDSRDKVDLELIIGSALKNRSALESFWQK